MRRKSGPDKEKNRLPVRREGAGMMTMHPLSGKEILDHIVGAHDPRTLVQGLPHGDFYWMVKRVGNDDCLPILEQASVEQWQYILDMETWNRDQLDLNQVAAWLTRLQAADPHRLAKWLLSGGEAIAYYFLYRSIQVEIEQSEDPSDFPPGFFTLDGTYYIRALNPQQRPLIEELLRFLAGEDLEAYQSLLLGLAGVLPAEAEEQLYRMRGIRLAEHGFLPFDEAISIYSLLTPRIFGTDGSSGEGETAKVDEVPAELLSLAPFAHLNKDQMFVSAVRGFSDALLRDRIYLEFAGLCNQLLSADGVTVRDLDVLVRTCRKAAGYVNLSLENTCAGDMYRASEILKKHSLVSLFRVGFGFVLRLKWEVAQWKKEAWFSKNGLDLSFWGDRWGEIIGGLLFEKPLFYCGDRAEEQYRDFRGLADFEACTEAVRNVTALDYLFSRLCKSMIFPGDKGGDENFTFHPLLFNVWARHILASPLSFEGLTVHQVRMLFSRLRAGDEGAPYEMCGFEEIFVSDMLRLAGVRHEPKKTQLKKVLSLLWQFFRKEYGQVSLEDLDQRFSRYLTIVTSPEVDLP